jgi:preprotein translocase subunit SecY
MRWLPVVVCLPFRFNSSLFSYHGFTEQVNSSGVMPIIFSTSPLALPGTLARFTGISALKKAALALNPGGEHLLFWLLVLKMTG